MPEFRKCFCSSGRNASFWFDKFDYFSGKEKTFNCHYVFKKNYYIALFAHFTAAILFSKFELFLFLPRCR